MRRLAAAAAVGAVCLAGGAVAAAPATVSLSLTEGTFSGTAVTALPGYGARGTDVVDYRHGARVRMTLPVRNGGVLPLTVTRVDLGDPLLPLLEVVSSTSRTLGPGESGQVVVEAVLGNCRYYHEREIDSYDAVRVGYSVLGRSGTRTLSLARPLLVHAPMIVGCPDRKLDRQADNRTDP